MLECERHIAVVDCESSTIIQHCSYIASCKV